MSFLALDTLKNFLAVQNYNALAKAIEKIAKLMHSSLSGNLLSFVVLRRGELKKISTCFYMSVLALADTGRSRFNH